MVIELYNIKAFDHSHYKERPYCRVISTIRQTIADERRKFRKIEVDYSLLEQTYTIVISSIVRFNYRNTKDKSHSRFYYSSELPKKYHRAAQELVSHVIYPQLPFLKIK